MLVFSFYFGAGPRLHVVVGPLYGPGLGAVVLATSPPSRRSWSYPEYSSHSFIKFSSCDTHIQFFRDSIWYNIKNKFELKGLFDIFLAVCSCSLFFFRLNCLLARHSGTWIWRSKKQLSSMKRLISTYLRLIRKVLLFWYFLLWRIDVT